jgi:hypothetical protein
VRCVRKEFLSEQIYRMRLLEMTGQSLEKMSLWPLLLQRRSFPWSMELFLTYVLGGL